MLEIQMQYSVKKSIRIPINAPEICHEIFTKETVYLSFCVLHRPHFSEERYVICALTQKHAIIFALYFRVPLHDKTELHKFRLQFERE